jgi:glycosyltransferase involved in cell wall biosynthesis
VERESRWSALRLLIRRWRVECLVSWNGTVDFYDHAAALGADLPNLRILAQLYNHEGGWIDHLSDSFVDRTDGHLAVNDHIARALLERGVPPDKVHTVHHGVEVPEPAKPGSRAAVGRQRRRELGLPEDAVVIGTFVRMHRQKRPLDVVRMARRMTHHNIRFLLVGGGPLDEAIDREIARDPPPNLLRLPMQTDVRPLFDALDICLMTSQYEGLPVFLLEGLAREIPCVTTRAGEVAELLADGGGRLVDRPGDLDGLERAVVELLDPETRRREGKRGRQTVARRYSLAEFVSCYERLVFP